MTSLFQLLTKCLLFLIVIYTHPVVSIIKSNVVLKSCSPLIENETSGDGNETGTGLTILTETELTIPAELSSINETIIFKWVLYIQLYSVQI